MGTRFTSKVPTVIGSVLSALVAAAILALSLLNSVLTAADQTSQPTLPASDLDVGITLSELIPKAISAGGGDFSRWGITVVSLEDARTLYSLNGDRLFTPASNMKLLTTAAALELLGENYQWRTSVYTDQEVDAGGVVKGNLILYGRGAPDLISQANTSSLSQLAESLYKRGVRHVKGNVIGDESYFRGDPIGQGWQWNDLQWYFGAEASALSIDSNQIYLSVLSPTGSGSKPEARLSTPGDHFSIINNMTTASRGEPTTIGIHRGLSDNNISIWGQLPVGSRGVGVRLSVHNPAQWAAKLFLEALKSRGMNVEGEIQIRDSRMAPSQRFEPEKAIELASANSKPLAEIVKSTNKQSINLSAELILRTLGRERGDLVESPKPQGRERGDDELGVAVIRLWMNRNGIPTDGLALHDGSGLSRLNLITPQAMAKLLFVMNKASSAQSFKESLPIAGQDGTLRSRLGAVNARVLAKTGTLTYHDSLAGYLESTRQSLAFSIVCNDHTAKTGNTRTIDEIVSLIAAHSR